ncbi:MAG: tetratricopeptide repeat protein [Deltaproteobacteria bacterium]
MASKKNVEVVKDSGVSLGLRMETSLFKLKKFVDGLVDAYCRGVKIESQDTKELVSKKAEKYMERADYGKAADEFNRLIMLGKEEPSLYCNLGLCCERLGMNEESEAAYKKAVQLDEHCEDAFYQLGVMAIKNDKPKDAIKYFQGIKDAGSYEIAYQLGVAYDKVKEHTSAIACFEKAIKLEPRRPQVYKRLGYVYDAMGRHEEAVECFKKAMELEEV